MGRESRDVLNGLPIDPPMGAVCLSVRTVIRHMLGAAERRTSMMTESTAHANPLAQQSSEPTYSAPWQPGEHLPNNVR